MGAIFVSIITVTIRVKYICYINSSQLSLPHFWKNQLNHNALICKFYTYTEWNGSTCNLIFFMIYLHKRWIFSYSMEWIRYPTICILFFILPDFRYTASLAHIPFKILWIYCFSMNNEKFMCFIFCSVGFSVFLFYP